MGIIFELAVNFGSDEGAVQAAAEAVRRAECVEVRGVKLPIVDPEIHRIAGPNAYIELSVYPRGLGYGGPGRNPEVDPRSLTNEELTNVGGDLYTLLRGFVAYRAAAVGWNPESMVDVQDLEADLMAGHPPAYDGLVLADDLCERWSLGPEWIEFSDGYRWLPYQGSNNIW